MKPHILILAGLLGSFFGPSIESVEAQERLRINWEGAVRAEDGERRDHGLYVDLGANGRVRSYWVDDPHSIYSFERRIPTYRLPQMRKSYEEVSARRGKRFFRIKLISGAPKKFALMTPNDKRIYVEFETSPPDNMILILREGTHGNWMLKVQPQAATNLNVSWIVDPNDSSISSSPNSQFSHCFLVVRQVGR